jgi:hypothetical protein
VPAQQEQGRAQVVGDRADQESPLLLASQVALGGRMEAFVHGRERSLELVDLAYTRRSAARKGRAAGDRVDRVAQRGQRPHDPAPSEQRERRQQGHERPDTGQERRNPARAAVQPGYEQGREVARLDSQLPARGLVSLGRSIEPGGEDDALGTRTRDADLSADSERVEASAGGSTPRRRVEPADSILEQLRRGRDVRAPLILLPVAHPEPRGHADRHGKENRGNERERLQPTESEAAPHAACGGSNR